MASVCDCSTSENTDPNEEGYAVMSPSHPLTSSPKRFRTDASANKGSPFRYPFPVLHSVLKGGPLTEHTNTVRQTSRLLWTILQRASCPRKPKVGRKTELGK